MLNYLSIQKYLNNQMRQQDLELLKVFSQNQYMLLCLLYQELYDINEF